MLLLGWMVKDSLWCWEAGKRPRIGRGEVVEKEENAF